MMSILRVVRFCWQRKFLSAVRNASKPANSAASRRSPFTRRSHPRSLASVTVCALRWRRSGAGVLWSKRTSIYCLRRGFPGRNRRIEAAGRKFEHSYHLLARDVKPFHALMHGSPGVHVLEDNGNRHPRSTEDPGAAYFAGDAFYGGAL